MDSSAGFRYKDEDEEDNPQYVLYLPNYPTGGELTLLGPYDSRDKAVTALKGLVWVGEVIELWPPDSE